MTTLDAQRSRECNDIDMAAILWDKLRALCSSNYQSVRSYANCIAMTKCPCITVSILTYESINHASGASNFSIEILGRILN